MAEDQIPQEDQIEHRSNWGAIGLGVASNLATGGVKVGAKFIGKQMSENLQSLKGDEPPKDE
jgi:hypothetical protein